MSKFHLLALMILPFYLNDFLYRAFQTHFFAFMAVAYATDVIAIAIALAALKWRRATREEFYLELPPRSVLTVGSLFLCAVGVLIDRSLGPALRPLFESYIYFEFPSYPNPVLRWVDLIIGISLVAVAEELVFRGLLLSQLQKHFSRASAGLISIALFAGFHWGSGIHSVINSAVYSILPTIFVLRYRSIYPLIAAHFVTDFVAFYLFQ